jgi:hypothetical protein
MNVNEQVQNNGWNIWFFTKKEGLMLTVINHATATQVLWMILGMFRGSIESYNTAEKVGTVPAGVLIGEMIDMMKPTSTEQKHGSQKKMFIHNAVSLMMMRFVRIPAETRTQDVCYRLGSEAIGHLQCDYQRHVRRAAAVS